MKTKKLPKAQENASHVVSLSSESYQLRKWRNFFGPITLQNGFKVTAVYNCNSLRVQSSGRVDP